MIVMSVVSQSLVMSGCVNPGAIESESLIPTEINRPEVTDAWRATGKLAINSMGFSEIIRFSWERISSNHERISLSGPLKFRTAIPQSVYNPLKGSLISKIFVSIAFKSSFGPG